MDKAEMRRVLDAYHEPGPVSRAWAAEIARLIGCTIEDLQADGLDVAPPPFVVVFVETQDGPVAAPDVPVTHALASTARRLLERGRSADRAASVALRAVGMPAEDARIESASDSACRLVLTPWT